MIISDFTAIELDYLRRSCNFVGYEREVFELRSQGISLEQVAERVDMSVDGVKKISRKVNSKIARVTH
jgi:ATP/maltotriose-dependent transcriptional regulator MalT